MAERSLILDATGTPIDRSAMFGDTSWNGASGGREMEDWEASRGSADADGYLSFAGRAKEVINRGGSKVYPKEIEDLLSGHPNVRDAAVVGWPDARLGETVCAFVVPEGDAPTLDDIRRYCDEQKATLYMVPQHLVILSEFPMTPTGKVRKASLQEDAARRAQAEKEGAAS